MAYLLLTRVHRQACLVGVLSFLLGCTSTLTEHQKFMGEGFQSYLPNSGARVVVWGNHSGAVMRTLKWLHNHQILGVDPSWIQKELSDPGFAHRMRKEQSKQVIAAARSVGATLVLFAQVEDNQLGREFDFKSFSYKRMKIIDVEIRGMRVSTGNVVFGAKAWNSMPLIESEQIVQDLTTFALQKAWNENNQPLVLQKEKVNKKLEKEDVTVMTASLENTDFADSVSEEPQTEKSQPVSSNPERPFGLQIASGALSLLYTPVKIAYAGLGGFMGGLTYILTAGNQSAAQSVWDASLNGTYWLTAKHLQGEESVRFKGEPSSFDSIHHVRLDRTGGLQTE